MVHWETIDVHGNIMEFKTNASLKGVHVSVVNAVGCTTNYCSVVINCKRPPSTTSDTLQSQRGLMIRHVCVCLSPGRTPAVCQGDSLGWTISIVILVSLSLYVALGVAYGRSKNPPTKGRPRTSSSRAQHRCCTTHGTYLHCHRHAPRQNLAYPHMWL